MAHVFEFIYAFFREAGRAPTAEDIYKFSHHYPYWATVVAFVLVCLLIMFLAPNFFEMRRSVSKMSLNRRAIGVLALATLVTLYAANVSVKFLHNTLEPVPTLEAKETLDFVRQPVVLTWKRVLPEGVDKDTAVTFKIQRAEEKDVRFSQPYNKPDTDGNSLYDFKEGIHWWRVQAWADGHELTHGWSKPVQTSFYWTAYSRILATKRLRFYVSSSANQGIFKFLLSSGELSGADVAIARRIALALEKHLPASSDHRRDATILAPSPTPITWSELLEQPKQGSADIIISSISRSNKRENDHGLKFSKSYFCTGQSILFRKKDAPSATPIKEYLHGKTVAYQANTTSDLLVEALLKDNVGQDGSPFLIKKSFTEAAALVEALHDQRSPVQVVVTDTPFALDASLSAPSESPLETRELSDTEDYPDSVPPSNRLERYAVGVAQGETELLKVIDEVITGLVDGPDPELKKVLKTAAETKFKTLKPPLTAQQLSSLVASKPCPDWEEAAH
jgi:ABC-type amino acid transport substrate-binding protein